MKAVIFNCHNIVIRDYISIRIGITFLKQYKYSAADIRSRFHRRRSCLASKSKNLAKEFYVEILESPREQNKKEKVHVSIL